MNKELLESAKQARKQAYAPYSRHHVGAAVLTKSGKIYSSGNVENGCYALTICAERGALYHAIANGEFEFEALAVTNGSAELITPCGVCRQVLWELAGEIDVIMFTSRGKKVVMNLSKLYPKPYKKKSKKRLLKHRKK
ncbi:MAG: cytidine deaminase [Deltaproteobacteria bacterium]|nr:MAG: cytidine deaminase [Deltaproteobacteria bacterium]